MGGDQSGLARAKHRDPTPEVKRELAKQGPATKKPGTRRRDPMKKKPETRRRDPTKSEPESGSE